MVGREIVMLKDLQCLKRLLYIGFIITFILIHFLPISKVNYEKNRSATIKNETYLVIAPDDTLVGWGINDHGLIANTIAPFYIPYIARTEILKNVSSVYIGYRCAMAVDNQGVLWGWGEQPDLLLYNSTTPMNRPVKIMENVMSVGLGTYHVSVLTTDGILWGWGNLFTGSSENDSLPHQTYQPTKIMSHVKSVSSCGDITLAVKHNGDLYILAKENGNSSRVVLNQVGRNIQDVICIDPRKNTFLLLDYQQKICILRIGAAIPSGWKINFTHVDLPGNKAIYALSHNGVLSTDGVYYEIGTCENSISVHERDDFFIPIEQDLPFYSTANIITPTFRNIFFLNFALFESLVFLLKFYKAKL